jgi:ABC-2 type transport system ATP-binding protein
LYGILWKVPSGEIKNRIENILNIFDLSDIRKKEIEDLSIGQRRRLQIAREFIHEMDLLFLDEPTVGLDPTARRTLLDYIKQKVKEGLTIFFTTHIMEEAEYLCDEIAIIDNGKVIAIDSPASLKESYGETKTVEITLKHEIPSKYPVMKLLDRFNQNKENVRIDDTKIIISSKDSQQVLIKIIELFSKNKIEIDNISISSPSLEEVFFNIMKKSK